MLFRDIGNQRLFPKVPWVKATQDLPRSALEGT